MSTLITAEEHSTVGGLGAALAECIVAAYPVPLRRVGPEDCFVESGPYAEFLDKYGLSTEAILSAVGRVAKRKFRSMPVRQGYDG